MSRSRSGTNYFYSYSVATDSSHCCLHVTFVMKIFSFSHSEVNYISMDLKFGFGYWIILWGFPGGSDGKESACNIGDPGSIPGVRKIPWRRESQYSCQENSMDRGAWQAAVHGVTMNRT